MLSALAVLAGQLMGGLALHEGKLAEMATGEGKTLVATLPCYLNALAGKGTVLVVTANDYLARRDAETMGQVWLFCFVFTAFRVSPYHQGLVLLPDLLSIKRLLAAIPVQTDKETSNTLRSVHLNTFKA